MGRSCLWLFLQTESAAASITTLFAVTLIFTLQYLRGCTEAQSCYCIPKYSCSEACWQKLLDFSGSFSLLKATKFKSKVFESWTAGDQETILKMKLHIYPVLCIDVCYQCTKDAALGGLLVWFFLGILRPSPDQRVIPTQGCPEVFLRVSSVM